MQLGLAVGLGQEGEELRDALVFFRLLAAHHPQRSAADDRVLRRALDVGIIGHRRRGEVELGGALGGGVVTRRGQEDRAFARGKTVLAVIVAAGIVVGLVLLQLDQVLQMLHMQRRVECQYGVEAVEAIRLGADRHVMPGRELLDMRPRSPRRWRSRRSCARPPSASWRRQTLPARSSEFRRRRPSSIRPC